MFVYARNTSQKTVFSVLSLFLFFFSSIHSEAETRSIFLDVKELFNASLDIGKQEEPAQVDKKQKLTLKIEQPSGDQMKFIAMDCMSRQPDALSSKATVLDRFFLKKMEICCGEENAKKSLAHVLDNSTTTFGHIMWVRKLAEPICDAEELINIQKVLKEFLGCQSLRNDVQKQLDAIKKAEPYFLSYFKQENAVNEELFKKVYWGDRLSFLNSNQWTLELGVRLGNLTNLYSVLALPTSLVVSSASIIQLKAQINSNPTSFSKACATSLAGVVDPRLKVYKDVGLEGRKQSFVNSFQGLQELNEQYNDAIRMGDRNEIREKQRMIEKQSQEFVADIFNFIPETSGDVSHLIGSLHGTSKYVALGVLGSVAALQGYLMYSTVQDAKLKQDIAYHLQAKMIAVATYINAMKELYEIVKENTILATIPGIEALAALCDPHSSLSADCKKLLDLLDHATFTGDASVFSLTGRVLAAHRLMQKVKEELVPACAAAGKIDAYFAAAKLYKKFQDTPLHFCFAQFVENAEKPMIKAVNFFNPFIDVYTVIANSIELGGNNPNNIILTGPNTGGKTTVIKGLELCILFAQTWGIAPADEFILTLFASLNCYLNITDDLSAGTSLFKAEVLRAKALIESIRKLGPQQFSFTIIDEVFSGTSPKEGEEAALMFAQELARMDQSLCALATHFPRLTDELSQEHFKNYKVTVYKDASGQWVRPFKLEEGKSLLNIAMDLLREEGIFN